MIDLGKPIFVLNNDGEFYANGKIVHSQTKTHWVAGENQFVVVEFIYSLVEKVSYPFSLNDGKCLFKDIKWSIGNTAYRKVKTRYQESVKREYTPQDTGIAEVEKKNLYEILVPTVKNAEEERYWTTKEHKIWDSKVRAIAGGLSILKPILGQWVNPSDSETVTERMIPVRICCTEQQIDKIADLTAKYYVQKAVMFYRISDDVKIKHY